MERKVHQALIVLPNGLFLCMRTSDTGINGDMVILFANPKLSQGRADISRVVKCEVRATKSRQ